MRGTLMVGLVLMLAACSKEKPVDCDAYAQKLLREGDAKALYEGGTYLGSLYRHTNPPQLCQKQAWPLFEKSAAEGNTDAMVMLGMGYAMGGILESGPNEVQVEYSPQKAWQWYEKAAQAGNSLAVARLKEVTKKGEITKEEESTWWDKKR